MNLDQLIDTSMLILSNASREWSLNVLPTTKNSVLILYREIKWSFHEFKDINMNIRAMERNLNILKVVVFGRDSIRGGQPKCGR